MEKLFFNDGEIFIGGRTFVVPNQIAYFEADVNYTKIFYVNGRKACIATTLKQMESRFQAIPRFFRINKSLIINLDCIQHIEAEKIILQNGQSFMPSRRRKKAFFEFLNL
jgi:DNA-binding LytR/AlgR family response regulator